MSLFAARDEEDDSAARGGAGRPRTPRRVLVGWVLIAAAVVLAAVLAATPAPYVIEGPGPVYNTLGVDTPVYSPQGTTRPSANAKQVLAIPSAVKTYPTKGQLDLLTVNLYGNPDALPSWSQVVQAWFDPSRTVVPVDVEFPAGETSDQSSRQSAQDMATSQQDATVAALRELGHTIGEQVIVGSVDPTLPANGILKPDDAFVSVNGVAVTGTAQLRKLIGANGASTPATFVIERAGVRQTVRITPVESSGAAVIGVYIGVRYDRIPVAVTINLSDVGGPSAGQMFALGIIDKLTPGFLNAGLDVAGTGTIDGDGDVGAIGGIRQKMYAAKAAGATIFLAPASNCDEVVGHVPAGLSVFAVNTLRDSLVVLAAESSGTGVGALPTCGS
ncbi:S16 family serine protease [Gryllotalpicola sp.]|uniref:YlbL family protein n=1 Tax=Gryllotalpicola sp. TaxID=1932787 RepID=UPI002638DF22|nr:S16 family serine protease [Gryllotalpicola sp.]